MTRRRRRRSRLAVAAVLLLPACAPPGTSTPQPEGRRVTIRIPAPGAAVFDRALTWIQGAGYPVVDLLEPERVRAEWPVTGYRDRHASLDVRIEDQEQDGRVTVLSIRGETFRGSGAVLTRMGSNDPSVSRAVAALAAHLSCEGTRWEGCPPPGDRF